VLLTEGRLAELPCEGQGRTIGGRPQIEAGQPPWEYVEFAPYGEIGWSPETYITAFLTAVERTGKVLDEGTLSFLTGAYLPVSGCVPRAYWLPLFRQAYLGTYHPGFGYQSFGARAAVTVL
jgi:hypothetical protein